MSERTKTAVAVAILLLVLVVAAEALMLARYNTTINYWIDTTDLWIDAFNDEHTRANYWHQEYYSLLNSSTPINVDVSFEDLELGLGELRVTSHAQLENGTKIDSATMIILLTFEGGASYRLENGGLTARSLGCPSPETSMSSLQRMFSNNLVLLSASNITHQFLTMENFEYNVSLGSPYGILTQSSAGYLHLNISHNEVLIEIRDFNQIFWVAELQITQGEYVYYKGLITDSGLLVEIELKNVKLADGTFIEYLKTSYQTGGE